MKQDRAVVRTAQDLERKYDLGSLVGIKKNIELQKDQLYKTNTILEDFMESTLGELEHLQSQVDGNITSWFYDGVPTLSNLPASEWVTDNEKSQHLGDLYYDTETGYAYRFTTSDNTYFWKEIEDNATTEALRISSEAKDLADGKRRVFIAKPNPPYDQGDLWLNNKELFVCEIARESGSFSEGDFVTAVKYTDNTELNNFVNVTFKESMKSITGQIDLKITTWYMSGVPTLTNEPAKNWSADEKNSHEGDLYFDKNTGKTYRFIITGWALVEDEGIAESMAMANASQDTADSKRRVFLAEPYPPYDNGDLWLNDQEIFVCQVSREDEDSYEEGDFIIATKYTDDTIARQVGENLEVLQGTVLTVIEDAEMFKAEVRSLDNERAGELELLRNELTIKFTDTINTLNEVNASLQEQINYITKYFVFDINGLTIGQVDNPNKVRIDNDEIEILVGDNTVQKFSADGKAIIPDITIEDKLKIFDYEVEKDASGNVNIGYVGGGK